MIMFQTHIRGDGSAFLLNNIYLGSKTEVKFN